MAPRDHLRAWRAYHWFLVRRLRINTCAVTHLAQLLPSAISVPGPRQNGVTSCLALSVLGGKRHLILSVSTHDLLQLEAWLPARSAFLPASLYIFYICFVLRFDFFAIIGLCFNLQEYFWLRSSSPTSMETKDLNIILLAATQMIKLVWSFWFAFLSTYVRRPVYSISFF